MASGWLESQTTKEESTTFILHAVVEIISYSSKCSSEIAIEHSDEKSCTSETPEQEENKNTLNRKAIILIV